VCGNCRNVEQQLSGVHAAAAELFSGGADLDDTVPDGPSAKGSDRS